MPGKDDEAKARNYVRAMAHMVEDAFPTAFITQRLAKAPPGGNRALHAFFEKAQDFDIKRTRLDNYLAANPRALDGVAPKQREELKQQVRAMQRLYRVAPRYAQTSLLMKAGFDSAYAISRRGKVEFALQYGEGLGGQREARIIYEHACQTTATAMNLLVEYGMPSMALPTTAVFDNTVLTVEGIPDWSTLFGSLDLCECPECRSVYSPAAYLVDILHFLQDRGLVDTVTRDEWNNVTGFTYKQKTLPGGRIVDKSAKDVLFERRADLGEIDLTCENTNILVPYVDLVNEALEEFVAPCVFSPFQIGVARESNLDNRTLSSDLRNAFSPPLAARATITTKRKGLWWTIDDLRFTYTIRKEGARLRVTQRGRQTSGPPEERAANPQYISAKAYEKLRGQVFPWHSPFDLWAEECGVYLEHLGVQRHAVMEAFARTGERAAVLDDIAIARKYLGMTAALVNLVTGATTAQADAEYPGVWNLWGFPNRALGTLDVHHAIPDPADSTRWITSGDWLPVLAGRMDVFVQQSGLKYKDVLDLLTTHYINPVTDAGERTVTIQSTKEGCEDTCALQDLKLDGLTEGIALKIPRFVRLWRALGWHAYDVDRAVTALAAADLDEAFLKRLSQVKRLHERLGVPVERLLAFWVPADADSLLDFWAPSGAKAYIDHHAAGQPVVPSLYTRLFRNKTVISPPDGLAGDPPDAVFVEDPTHLVGTLSAQVATIAAALGISAEDLSLLLNESRVIPPPQPTRAGRMTNSR